MHSVHSTQHVYRCMYIGAGDIVTWRTMCICFSSVQLKGSIQVARHTRALTLKQKRPPSKRSGPTASRPSSLTRLFGRDHRYHRQLLPGSQSSLSCCEAKHCRVTSHVSESQPLSRPDYPATQRHGLQRLTTQHISPHQQDTTMTPTDTHTRGCVRRCSPPHLA
jgi:hypothetical protein